MGAGSQRRWILLRLRRRRGSRPRAVAIGTETNGSITCPAALNGVVGLKPTVGSVSTAGVVPISASQDVPGPLARTVRDAALVYEVLSGRADCVAACSPDAAAPLTVGVVDAWLSGDARTDALFAEAVSLLDGLVAEVRAVDVPPNDWQVNTDQVAVLVGELLDDMDAYLSARDGDGPRSLAEVVAFNAAHAADELAAFGQEYFEDAVAGGGQGVGCVPPGSRPQCGMGPRRVPRPGARLRSRRPGLPRLPPGLEVRSHPR